MTHEWFTLWTHYKERHKNERFVLASVVHLEGSSYRRPGVRMLISEQGERVGAVSGGCVEKEVQRQAEAVFASQKPKMMQYDGRYRLGCEGILYLLLEPFDVDEDHFEALDQSFNHRKLFQLQSYYSLDMNAEKGLGTIWSKEGNSWPLSSEVTTGGLCFKQELSPRKRLLIFGGEHDAVVISAMAAAQGYEVGVVTDPKERKKTDDFPAAHHHEEWSAGQEVKQMHWPSDQQTNILVMSHNFARDLAFLGALSECPFAYLGILGPAHRREKLVEGLFDHFPSAPLEFPDRWNAPAGLDLGAENAAEIGLSILSEILLLERGHSGERLKHKKGKIHGS